MIEEGMSRATQHNLCSFVEVSLRNMEQLEGKYPFFPL